MDRSSRRTRLQSRITVTDRRVLSWIVRHRSPAIDRSMTTLSTAADNGKLWVAVAGVLAATGRKGPRSAAAAGLLGQAIASAVANGPLKFWWQRERPAADPAPLLPLPRTFSFPSGHSASAFAFAAGVTSVLPAAGPFVLPLAGLVAYSRAHTGVHYPSDVVVGSAIGAAAGVAAGRTVTAVRAAREHYADTPPLPVHVGRRAVVLASSSSGAAAELGPALRALQAGGMDLVEQIDVSELDRLRALFAGDDPPALVLAAGGDGTVGAAAQVVHGTPSVLGVIPLGTSNDTARSLGITPDPVEAVGAVLDGQVRAVDVGWLRVGDDDRRVFVNAATMGLNVAFAQLATEGGMRERFRGLTYPVAAAKAIRGYEPFHCEIDHDGRRVTYDVVNLSVSNATVFGGVLGMRVPRASMTDGRLDLIVVERLSLARLAIAVGDTLVGRHHPVRRVHGMQVDTLRVTGPADKQVTADGEVVGAAPVRFGVYPAALRVLTPRR